MKEEHIDFLRKQINESVETYENAISDICVSKSELVSHTETVVIYQKRLIIALQNKIRCGENKNTLRKIACPKCGNIGAEVVKEDLQTQCSIVTFKCAKCEYDFKEEY